MNKISDKNIPVIWLVSIISIFVIVTVICVILFIKADTNSHNARLMNQAVIEATSVAETLKASDGNLQLAGQLLREHQLFDVSENTLILYYDNELRPASQIDAPYKAIIRQQPLHKYFAYEITILNDETNKDLYKLTFKTVISGGDH